MPGSLATLATTLAGILWGDREVPCQPQLASEYLLSSPTRVLGVMLYLATRGHFACKRPQGDDDDTTGALASWRTVTRLMHSRLHARFPSRQNPSKQVRRFHTSPWHFSPDEYRLHAKRLPWRPSSLSRDSNQECSFKRVASRQSSFKALH